jgi:hypothetical protein
MLKIDDSASDWNGLVVPKRGVLAENGGSVFFTGIANLRRPAKPH